MMYYLVSVTKAWFGNIEYLTKKLTWFNLVSLNGYSSGLKSVLLGDTYVYKNIIQVFIQQTFY